MVVESNSKPSGTFVMAHGSVEQDMGDSHWYKKVNAQAVYEDGVGKVRELERAEIQTHITSKEVITEELCENAGKKYDSKLFSKYEYEVSNDNFLEFICLKCGEKTRLSAPKK